ncbi:hypothetical protein BDQ12DRAFT_682805 [Crucibulum laeve]|uniref:Uncharacterized protein n=1 Tax=Crucibulum laeve TaxID=68775 RepID=A0A5C3M1W2_9AGAR|nr:hypothetical protein BDQ12DRAFT_682805 [Crucibulum laeve]
MQIPTHRALCWPFPVRTYRSRNCTRGRRTESTTDSSSIRFLSGVSLSLYAIACSYRVPNTPYRYCMFFPFDSCDLHALPICCCCCYCCCCCW